MSKYQTRQEYIDRERNRGRGKKKKRGCFSTFLVGCLTPLLVLLIAGGAFAYYTFHSSVNEINNDDITDQIETVRDEEVTVGQDPISILLLGIDTGEYDRVGDTGGRSDIMMVVTVNPDTNQAYMTSIPRDSYTEIVGYGTMDKINHAYAFGGISMSANTVQNFLNIPIDYVISMDMGGFVDIIDTMGGVEITPVETFEQEGYYFVEGETQMMDGSRVLQYIRNRYTDTGDYGRQLRARQVLGAVADQLVSLDSVTNVGGLVNIVQENVVTNLDVSEAQSLALDANSILDNLEMLQLEGSSETIDGVYYEMIDPASLEAVSSTLRENLELE